MNSFETIKKALTDIAGNDIIFSLDQPEDSSHGDYATNIAFALSKKQNTSPKVCADNLIQELQEKLKDTVSKIEVAGSGFINFYLKDEVRFEEVKNVSLGVSNFSSNDKTVLVEHTDPNCFKVFHIGHFMTNAIGESIARIYELGGYKVTRVCYPSDIGRNVAMGVWGAMKKEDEKPKPNVSLKEKVEFLGTCYAYANGEWESDEIAKQEILEVNKTIYNGGDKKVMEVYAEGRALSLEYFETMYKRLGTTFDNFIFESEVSESGLSLVEEYLKKGIFEKSEGAIVYKGEQDGLHTRVFVNALGLPTYEAKDLGNYEKKIELLPNASYYVAITANEQNEYFKVVNVVEKKIRPELTDKLVHFGHGMLRLPKGKMSSRTGNVISADDLINEVADKIKDMVKEVRVDENETAKLVDDISIGAIKFSILKQAIGGDIIFDIDKSISFEGDSGPYLQYTHARICALIARAKEMNISDEVKSISNHELELERIISNYSQVLEKTFNEIEPHHIVQYLLLLTRAFNNLYGRAQIIDENNKDGSAYYIMITKSVKNILAHGLHTLGIVAPERM